MPRASNGTYTLPAGNPVVVDTDILASWANTTLNDIATALTNSLSRDGEGGMTVPLLFDDGAVNLPGISWESEPSTGFYMAAANDMRLSVAGVDKVRWTASEVMEFNIASAWVSIEDIGGTAEVSIESRSIAYTFVLDDAQTYQLLTGAVARTWVIPANATVAYPVGTVIVVATEDADITLDPDVGVTLNSVIAQASTASRTVVGGGTATLTQTAADVWQLTGDIA